MADENKRNLQYFEAPSMRELFGLMQAWQVENEKRLLSLSVEKDDAMFCCIAVTNPTDVYIKGIAEVVIVDGITGQRAGLIGRRLMVSTD